jgi:hypothetical protein
MESDEGLLALLGLDVFEYLLFIIDKEVALLMGWFGDYGHLRLLSVKLPCLGTSIGTASCVPD